VTGLIFSVFTNISDQSLHTISSGIYTLIVGLIYIAGAAALFHMRKSEVAGQSAANRILQTVYRLCITFPICLISCYMIAQTILSGYTFNNSDIFGYAVIYIIAILVYFIYELITTRKWRNLVRAIPALGILLLMNLAYIGSIIGGYYSVLSIQPTANEIESVRLLSNTTNDYFTAKTGTVHQTDEIIRQVVADQLLYTNNTVRNNKQASFYNSVDNIYTQQQVAIYLKGRTIYRNILLRAEDYTTIAQQLGKNQAYRDAYMNLPKLGENGTAVNIYNLSTAQSTAVYNVMREEIAALDFEKWYTYLKSNLYSSGENIYYGKTDSSDEYVALPYSIVMSTSVGTSQYSWYFTLSSILPKTCQQVITYINQNDEKNTLDILQQGTWSAQDQITITGFNFTDQFGKEIAIEWNSYGDSSNAYFTEQLKAFANSLESMAGKEFDITKPFYRIEIYKNTSYEYGSIYEDDPYNTLLYINTPLASVPDFLLQQRFETVATYDK
jgi:ABC-2 type transport system permease protein